jgi:hypothetical protein
MSTVTYMNMYTLYRYSPIGTLAPFTAYETQGQDKSLKNYSSVLPYEHWYKWPPRSHDFTVTCMWQINVVLQTLKGLPPCEETNFYNMYLKLLYIVTPGY